MYSRRHPLSIFASNLAITRPRPLFSVYFATLVLRGNFEEGGGKATTLRRPGKTATTTCIHSHFACPPPSIGTTPSLKLKWPSCDAVPAPAPAPVSVLMMMRISLGGALLQTLTPDIALIHSPIQFSTLPSAAADILLLYLRELSSSVSGHALNAFYLMSSRFLPFYPERCTGRKEIIKIWLLS